MFLFVLLALLVLIYRQKSANPTLRKVTHLARFWLRSVITDLPMSVGILGPRDRSTLADFRGPFLIFIGEYAGNKRATFQNDRSPKTLICAELRDRYQVPSPPRKNKPKPAASPTTMAVRQTRRCWLEAHRLLEGILGQDG